MAQSSDPYEHIVDLYNLEHRSLTADIEMYLDFVTAAGGPVLELASGSGRVALAIAAAGYPVVGLDSSKAMLASADYMAVQMALQLAYRSCEARMEDAASAPGGPFGVVILALDALLHAGSQFDQIAVLRAAKAALDPRGQLLIDVFNPSPQLLAGFDGNVTLEHTWQLAASGTTLKFASRTVNAAKQEIETTLWYDSTTSTGALRRIATAYTLRYLYLAELTLMLELAGFAAWQVYGGYELEPFDDDADRIVIAAEVTAS